MSKKVGKKTWSNVPLTKGGPTDKELVCDFPSILFPHMVNTIEKSGGAAKNDLCEELWRLIKLGSLEAERRGLEVEILGGGAVGR